MKKNFILKSALCLTLAASILTMGACKSTGDNGDTTSASGDEQAAPVYYTDVPGSVKKSETVYVNMDNSGDVKDITVTDWLQGRDPAALYDACVHQKSGRFPRRPLYGRPDWKG